jgi:hypothetical protein
VEHICSLVFSPLRQPDRVVWSGTKNGGFTVRSAYHMEVTRRIQEGGETSSSKENLEFWKCIWSLQVLGVLKHFVWKVCSNTLPTKANL